MRIRSLQLAAFGPFTARTIEFNQQATGLHLVYGPNEAGKSSALRGLKALLYGIPDRTTDNFIHANEKLRLGGCLRAANGQEIAFVRRKGRKNTLSSLQDEPLDESVLAPFLQGVTLALFEALFGIDYGALMRGGQEMLEQKGEIGQALFSAALGSQALHSVLQQLDQEADGLFRPRGSTQAINAALKKYDALKLEIRSKSLPSQHWEDHDRALVRTTEELKRVQEELIDARTRLNRLQRMQRALPKLARRCELLHMLNALRDVTVLPDDFAGRHQAAAGKLETAEELARGARSRLERLSVQLAKLTVRQTILEAGDKIEALHGRLGAHRKAMQDRPHLDAEHQQMLANAVSLLKDIRPDLALQDVETLRPVLAKRQRINMLGNQFQHLSARVKQTERNVRETDARLKQARAQRCQLPVVGSPDALRRDTAAAKKLGALDDTIQAGRLELETLEAQCNDDLARLTLWRGALKDVATLPAPMRESIDRFDNKYEALSKRVQRLQDKQNELQDSLQETSRQLDEIQYTDAVPTEDDLNQARSRRDQVWNLLRHQWIDAEDVDTEASALGIEQPLPDAFETHLVRADELADHLRRQADRVHKQASLLAERDNARRSVAELARQLDEYADIKRAIDADWASLWAIGGFQPRAPREMREWLDRVENLREKIGRLDALRRQADARERTRNMHVELLKAVLQALDAEVPESVFLDAVLTQSEEIIAGIDSLVRQRETQDREIQTLERDLDTGAAEHQAAIGELDAWKRQWKDTMKGLSLGDDASPLEATDVLEKLRQLFDKLHESEKLRTRIVQIDSDADNFRDGAKHEVTRAAPELADLNIEEAAARLNTLLADNRARQSQRTQIEDQVQQTRQDIKTSDSTIEAMTARLDALCIEAECEGHAQLDTAERRSAEYVQLKTELTRVEQELLNTGEGATMSQLEAEAQNADPDALPGEIEALTNQIEETLEPRRTELATTKGGQEKALELMDGSDSAAGLAEQAQCVLAGIRSSAERYLRVKLAARVLRDEVERYRNENQGPLVKRASECFAVLTRNSFQGLRADFNEKDEPVLVGIRPAGERVRVDGMSSGTRAQLYLALRLASLEKYMESTEPMPFIVDDILVDFDDDRSKAALEAFTRLAQKTQVILFTHHSRVVEHAQALDGAIVYVHSLWSPQHAGNGRNWRAIEDQ